MSWPSQKCCAKCLICTFPFFRLPSYQIFPPKKVCDWTVTQSGTDCTSGASATTDLQTTTGGCAVYCCGLGYRYFEFSPINRWCNCFSAACSTFVSGFYDYGTITINTQVRLAQLDLFEELWVLGGP